MKLFRCECQAQIFFDNTECLSCGKKLGFVPETSELLPLDPEGSLELGEARWVKCRNYSEQGVCNWMVSCSTGIDLCQACELNHVIPDLSQPENQALWLEVEKAKRRLVYSLNRLGLAVASKATDPERGLSFDIKAAVGSERILTGHSDGLITLNLEEADPAKRERMRLDMRERYRTLLGHFRHEIGHYYWDRLVNGGPSLFPFRALFGDETTDYQQSLEAHYARSDTQHYADSFISAYAMSHPWEDFAETFAHYLHMVDTLETASQFGFVPEEVKATSPENSAPFEQLLSHWINLTVALNSLNRSMGLPDAYPFAISRNVAEKLRFIHDLTHQDHHSEEKTTDAQITSEQIQSYSPGRYSHQGSIASDR